ncbi:hypothetical protein, partial [Duncaniella freteri]|uniref:hypothetical protein n=1 Tax=Duncaniella freteri TaxID=2530391 RepID=UPI002557F081
PSRAPRTRVPGALLLCAPKGGGTPMPPRPSGAHGSPHRHIGRHRPARMSAARGSAPVERGYVSDGPSDCYL